MGRKRKGARWKRRKLERRSAREDARGEAPEAWREAERADPLRRRFSWETRERDLELAMLLRAALRHLPALARRSPWLPIPGDRCPFGFGPDGRPLPIGVAPRLWSPLGLGGAHHDCGGGRVVVLGGGGTLLSRGGLYGLCLRCGHHCTKFHGGISRVYAAFRDLLADTAFEPTNLRCERKRPMRWPLYEALRLGGAWPLPPESWAAGPPGSWRSGEAPDRSGRRGWQTR